MSAGYRAVPTEAFDEIPLLDRRSDSEDLMSEGETDRDYLVGRGRRRSMPQNLYYHAVNFPSRCWEGLEGMCRRQRTYFPRTLTLGAPVDASLYPSNAINNRKYNLFSFVPKVLWEQFKVFLNFYFLMMALSQFIPAIRVGLIWTYWVPLCFVITVTMIREAWDDLARMWRDRELNNALYEKLVLGGGRVKVRAADVEVGDLLVLKKDERVPADAILLRTTEREAGSCFIRTDQLDGETDWKLRLPLHFTQSLPDDAALFSIKADVYAEKPQKDIHSFIGTAKVSDPDEPGASGTEFPLNLENTLWAETVLASGTAVGLVVYTGSETRSAMNQSSPRSKNGLLDIEVNNLTKILFLVVMGLAFVMVILKGFKGQWYIYFFRFVLLFSYIIPISLRVNLDMAKATYCWLVSRDRAIEGTVVRSSTIPEELGRISFLLSDKTGTLTKNEMAFKKIHLGSVCFGHDTFDEVSHHLQTALSTGESSSSRPAKQSLNFKTFQAASPDEVALVKWTELMGISLVQRTLSTMRLRLPNGQFRDFRILHLFPFTSEAKRMGIIVKDESTGEITFLMKGADAVMKDIVEYNDWLDEECVNMAREGLRTLVVAKKILTEAQYQEFEKQYDVARVSKSDRSGSMEAVVRRLEKDLNLLCLTGVEDALQDEVAPTLEQLRNAGIRVWMLTGDKRETAICIAKSSGLFAKHEEIHVFPDVTSRLEAHTALNNLRRQRAGVGLVLTGSALRTALSHYESDVAELVCACSAVVCCRCSPEQKAQLAQLLLKYQAPLRVAAVGDGGNDVAMIQAAHAGIGIVGKEGRQAALAADFSIPRFSALARLMLVHGRYNYKRSSSLAQFVMHRGLIISAMQAVFSAIFYFVSVSLYPSVLMVAYSTFYTNFPVFSLVLDKDVKEESALTYPELYKELTKGRSLSYKTFFLWFLVSVYQGAVIMYGVATLWDDLLHMVSISFTSLILTELIMVALTIHSWHWVMVASEIVSLLIYIASLFVMPDQFDVEYMWTVEFIWKTAALTAVACVPTYIVKCLRHRYARPAYAKVRIAQPITNCIISLNCSFDSATVTPIPKAM